MYPAETTLINVLTQALDITDYFSFDRALKRYFHSKHAGLPPQWGIVGIYETLFSILRERKPGTSEWGCAGQVEYPQYDGPPSYSLSTRQLAMRVLARKLRDDLGTLAYTINKTGVCGLESDIGSMASVLLNSAQELSKIATAHSTDKSIKTSIDPSDRMPPCPKCGGPGECRHLGDINKGSTHYYDLYEFRCKNPECLHKENKEVHGGDSHGDNWRTVCPYCLREYPIDFDTSPDEPFDSESNG